MTEKLDERKRSQPVSLLILFLIATCLLTVLESLVQTRWITLPFLRLRQTSFLNFPFLFAILAWFASRQGLVSWKTWIVPAVLIISTLAIQMIGKAYVVMPGYPLHALTTRNFFPTFRELVGSHIYCCIFLMLLMRLSTLHLHPIELEAYVPPRMTIRLVLGLMIAVAICLTIEPQNQSSMPSQAEPKLEAQIILGLIEMVRVMPALIWASLAWLFARSNNRRWIGWVGLSIAFTWLCLQFFVLLPRFYSFGGNTSNMPMLASAPELMVTFFSHIFFALIWIGALHLAGYRWSIRE